MARQPPDPFKHTLMIVDADNDLRWCPVCGAAPRQCCTTKEGGILSRTVHKQRADGPFTRPPRKKLRIVAERITEVP